MSLLDKLLAVARARSPWVYLLNTGSCNGCDIEVVAALTPRYDAEQVGVLRQGSPKHADILVVTGPLTLHTHQALLEIYSEMPRPKAVVAVGSCPATGNVFAGSPTVMDGVCDTITVTAFVPGCPPRPQAVIEGIAHAAAVLAESVRKRKEASLA
ncbi:MAG: NADH-quinone oxidoreductase subunit NuoB [Deltaproteobacteria bacterium]|jgi:membrane-bound hydrogenase subunit mbhJ